MLFAGIGVVLDGPLILFFEGRTPHFRAWVTFGRSPKSDQKRCLKPQVSRLPARLGCAENRRRVPRGGTLFHGGRIRHFPAARGSGSGDRDRSDSAWALLRRGCDRTKGIPKTIGFWRRSFPPFLPLLKEMGPPETKHQSGIGSRLYKTRIAVRGGKRRKPPDRVVFFWR